MRFLVTGGCGFIGANLVRFLLEEGHQIRVLDNLSTGNHDNLAGLDVELLHGDIRDRLLVANASRDQNVIVHLAAITGVAQSIKDPRTCVNVNVDGTLNVLIAARDAGVGRVIVASTCGALFGNADPPVDEITLPSPLSPYGASKLACEALCASFNHSYGLDTVTLRLTNVYGPFLTHKRTALREFLYAAKESHAVTIFGDGKQTRDFLYVMDLVQAINEAAQRPEAAGKVFHLGSGVENSLLELAETVREVTGQDDLPVEFKEERPGEVSRTFTRINRAREILGFQPQFTLSSGVRETWKWLDSHYQSPQRGD